MVFVYMFDLDVRWSLNVHTCSILNVDVLGGFSYVDVFSLTSECCKKRRGKQSCCYFYISELIKMTINRTR